MRIEVDFFGEDLAAARIRGVGERAQDLRPAFREAVRILNRAAQRQFSSQGRYGGGSWKRLAASTLAEKARLGLDLRILHRSRRLLGSLTGKNADRRQRVNRQSLVFGTYTPYAKYHVTGTRHMPRRPPMKLPKPDRKLIVRAIHRRIMVEAGRA